MKRRIIMILALLLIVGLPACSGTGAPGESTVTLTAKIIYKDGSSFLAANMAEDANSADIYRINADNAEVTDPSGNKAESSALKAGMLVDILYNGTVQESFPMGLGGIKSIRIREQGDDIAGLYISVIHDLYEVDPGLNDKIQRLAFNLSGVSNLTATERTALVYQLGNLYGLETLQGTFDELCEQGYIDKNNLYFETGLLFTIKDSAIKDGKFTFDAEKWRGGTGAYFYNNCTARKADGVWTYTVGSEAIS